MYVYIVGSFIESSLLYQNILFFHKKKHENSWAFI
jgi:hypothetical protein